jgi:undecaprenyl phosphate-alpha-L-ara4FN deformylase
MKVGLRIDVDTFRGTRLGVPNLCRVLAQHSIKGSFFFSVGPDNMGRNLWRLLRPAFLWKMLRTKAATLYGWDIVFKGTFWPGPVIGERLGDVIRAAADAGHEIGLHAWDHQAWQAHIDSMDCDAIYQSITKGVTLLTRVLGRPPVCSAVPGWKCNNLVLKEKCKFPFLYNSDCRGDNIFYPVLDSHQVLQPQIPVTLPTYDEVIGCDGITNENYNECIFSLLTAEKLNVLAVHAEVEGIALAEMFDEFLDKACARGVSFVPLGSLLSSVPAVRQAHIASKQLPGREGWVAIQETDEI